MDLRLGRDHLAVTLVWSLLALLSVLTSDLIDAAANSDSAADIAGLPVSSSSAIDVRSHDLSTRACLAIVAVPVVSDASGAAPSVPRPPPGI